MSNIVKQLCFQPLNDPDLISLLSSFNHLFQSSLGPHGNLKIVVTAGGYSIVSSSSKRLISNVVVENPICIFITQIMKGQLNDFKDCGLYVGALLSNLLRKTLTQNLVPQHVASLFLQQIHSDLSCILNAIKFKVDFSTVKHLLPVVLTILNSKPACCLSKAEKYQLSISIVKAFLNSVCEDIGNVNVICAECCGFDSPMIISGTLYQITENTCSPHMDIFCRNIDKKLLILFNIMMSDEKSERETNANRINLELEKRKSFDVVKAINMLEKAIKLGVSIIACQKVVHPWLKLHLRRKNILLLDRMGTDITKHVANISGAVPISDLSIFDHGGSKEIERLLGHVDSVRKVSWGRKTYIALQRADKNVSTLLVRAANPEASEELKVTVDQALCSLCYLLVDPFLIPGNGCTEMSMAVHLHHLILQKHDKVKYNLPISHLQACVRWLQMSLLSTAGLLNDIPNLAVDTAYFHAWDGDLEQKRSRCRCGLVTSAMVVDRNEEWTRMDLNSDVLFSNCNQPLYVTSTEMTLNVSVDLYNSKCNALKLCLEGCVGLLGIGMIVSNPSSNNDSV